MMASSMGYYSITPALEGKAVRSLIVKARSLSKYAPKKVNVKPLRAAAKAALKKEKEVLQPQPSCSHHTPPPVRQTVPKKSKSQQSLKTTAEDKPKSPPAINHIAKNIQNLNCKKVRPNEDLDKIKLKEICFVNDTEGKKVIAKYGSDDNLVVAWSGKSGKAQVFSHKSRLAGFPGGSNSEARQRAFRVHNFHKNNATFGKSLKNKRIFKRLASNSETSKVKKKSVKKKGSRKEL